MRAAATPDLVLPLESRPSSSTPTSVLGRRDAPSVDPQVRIEGR